MEKVKIQFETPYYIDRGTLELEILRYFCYIEDDFYGENIKASFTWKDETIDLGVGEKK